MDSITTLLRELQTQKSQTNLNRRSNLLRDNYYLYIYLLKASMYKTNSQIWRFILENQNLKWRNMETCSLSSLVYAAKWAVYSGQIFFLSFIGKSVHQMEDSTLEI